MRTGRDGSAPAARTMRRATALLVATAASTAAAPTAADLSRARTARPGAHLLGRDFADTSAKLNAALRRSGVALRACADFSSTELNGALRTLLATREPRLDRIYAAAADRRALRHDGSAGYEAEWAGQARALLSLPRQYAAAAHDGKCHEAVMIYVHHLSQDQRAAYRRAPGAALPLLPSKEHFASRAEAQWHNGSSSPGARVVKTYVDQSACKICHGDPIPAPPMPVHPPVLAPVFPLRWHAKVHGTVLLRRVNDSMEFWESFEEEYWYDWATNRVRQDTTYNDTYPDEAGVSFFNGEKLYSFTNDGKTCIALPPPIDTVQRPDLMVNSRSEHVGRELLDLDPVPGPTTAPTPAPTECEDTLPTLPMCQYGHLCNCTEVIANASTACGMNPSIHGFPLNVTASCMKTCGACGKAAAAPAVRAATSLTDHWHAHFIRVNPKDLHSNASFDIWYDVDTMFIRRIIGQADPPDIAEGTPSYADAWYDSFEPYPSMDTMEEKFKFDVSGCIDINPYLTPAPGPAPCEDTIATGPACQFAQLCDCAEVIKTYPCGTVPSVQGYPFNVTESCLKTCGACGGPAPPRPAFTEAHRRLHAAHLRRTKTSAPHLFHQFW